MRYAVCLDEHFNATTGTCAHITFLDHPPSLLPPMTVGEGLAVSGGIVAVLGVAFCIRIISRVMWRVG